MNTPIIDPSTLTDEQREAIKEKYYIARIQAELLHYTTYDVMRTLRELFGVEFFNQKKGE